MYKVLQYGGPMIGFRYIDCPLGDWPDGVDFTKWMKRTGYQGGKTFGNEYGEKGRDECLGNIEIWWNKDAEYRYIACLSLSMEVDFELVFLKNLECLMLFIDATSPLRSLSMQTSYFDEITFIIGKLFRVLHGHDVIDACEECDPEQYKRDLAFQQKISERKERIKEAWASRENA